MLWRKDNDNEVTNVHESDRRLGGSTTPASGDVLGELSDVVARPAVCAKSAERYPKQTLRVGKIAHGSYWQVYITPPEQ